MIGRLARFAVHAAATSAAIVIFNAAVARIVLRHELAKWLVQEEVEAVAEKEEPAIVGNNHSRFDPAVRDRVRTIADMKKEVTSRVKNLMTVVGMEREQPPTEEELETAEEYSSIVTHVFVEMLEDANLMIVFRESLDELKRLAAIGKRFDDDDDWDD